MNPTQNFIYALCVSLILVSCSKNLEESAEDKLNKPNKPNKPNSKNFTVKETFNVGRNVFVRALKFDEKKNILWVGTSVGALEIDTVSGDVKNTYTRENGLANEYVFASYVANNNDVWLGTNGGGVSRLTQTGWKTYFPMHGLADYWVYSFEEQAGDAMWIGTWAGLSRFDYKTESFTTYLKELVNEWVYGLAVDSKERVWIATEGGINMFDGKKWAVWTHKDGLGAPNTQNLSFSPNTGLGTRSRHDLSVLYNGEETYNPNYIFCLEVDDQDNIWAGTWGGGASTFDGDTWKNFTIENGLAGNIVYSLDIKQKAVWFGTNKGLSHYENNEWQTIDTSHGLLDSHVYAVAIDNQNRVWAGTRHGVALIVESN